MISRINMDTITKRISDDLWVLNVMEVTVTRLKFIIFGRCFLIIMVSYHFKPLLFYHWKRYWKSKFKINTWFNLEIAMIFLRVSRRFYSLILCGYPCTMINNLNFPNCWMFRNGTMIKCLEMVQWPNGSA